MAITAGELRAILTELAADAPVLIYNDPFPVEIRETTPVLVSGLSGGMEKGIALVPDGDDYLEEVPD